MIVEFVLDDVFFGILSVFLFMKTGTCCGSFFPAQIYTPGGLNRRLVIKVSGYIYSVGH